MYEHILIASHGSELTQRATTQGLELAKVTDVTVTELGRRLSPEGWRRSGIRIPRFCWAFLTFPVVYPRLYLRIGGQFDGPIRAHDDLGSLG